MVDTIDRTPSQAEDVDLQRDLTAAGLSDKDKDRAKDLVQRVGHTVELTPENNRRIVRKINIRILPVILFVYFLQALDKATLAYASVFGLIEDTNLQGQEFSWLGSVVYAAQLVAQPLVAWCLVKLPLGKFLATTVFLCKYLLVMTTLQHQKSPQGRAFGEVNGLLALLAVLSGLGALC